MKKHKCKLNLLDQLFLQARFFSEIIRRLPEETFTLEVLENKQVAITLGKANFLVNGLDATITHIYR